MFGLPVFQFADKRERSAVILFGLLVVVLALSAGIGRSVNNYADIKFVGARFFFVQGSLLALWFISFFFYEKPPARFWVYGGAFFALIIFSFLPPLASGDAMTSLFRVKIMSLTHVNPYLVAPSQFPGDPWISGTSWRHIPMPYGPFWVILSLFFIPFTKIGLGTALFFYKVFMGAAAISAGRIIYAIAERLGIGGRKAEFIFLWNPLVLLTVFSDAHNDIIMLLLALLAIYFLLEEKYKLAMIFLTLSALVKYATLLALPFFALHFYRKKLSKNKILSAAAAVIILTVAIFYLFWQGTYTFRGLILASSIVSSNSLIVHTANIFGAGLGFFVKYKELILAIAASAIALIFFWSAKAEGRILKGIFWSFVILLLTVTDLFNWYLLWPLAFVPFMEEKKRPYFTSVLTLFGLLHINRSFWETFVYAALFYATAIFIDFGPRRLAELCRKRIFGRV